MDIEYPYATDAARRRLLYRLPEVPMPRRLLIAGDAEEASEIAQDWDGEAACTTRAGLAATPGEFRVDVVALPWLRVPGTSGGDPDAASCLAAAHRLLVPGGAVVGHAANLHALHRLASLSGALAIASAGWGGTLAGLERALRDAGFEALQCWYVQPNFSSPMGLVPGQRQAARAEFLRTLRASRASHGLLGYAARALLAHAGLGGMQQGELFFWASKPC